MNVSPVDIDVVIPVYNGERFIEEAINSVLAQSSPPKNLFIVNDGSTDRTRQILERLKGAHIGATQIVVISQPNQGLSAARNAGIHAAKSKFIAFLDADDRWLPNKLDRQLERFSKSPENLKPPKMPLGIVYCQFREILDSGDRPKTILHRFKPALEGDLLPALERENAVWSSGSGVLCLREIFETCGNFDPDLRACEDWDMWIRAAQRYSFACAPEILVELRRHRENMSKDTRRMMAANFSVIEKNLKRNPDVGASMIQKSPAFQVLQFPLFDYLAFLFSRDFASQFPLSLMSLKRSFFLVAIKMSGYFVKKSLLQLRSSLLTQKRVSKNFEHE